MFFRHSLSSCQLRVRLAWGASAEKIDEPLGRQLAPLLAIEMAWLAALGRRDIHPEILWQIENLILHDRDVAVILGVSAEERLIGDVAHLNIK